MAGDHRSSVWVDKDGTVHWDGDPVTAEEYEERSWLGFYTTKEAEQGLFPLKLLNGLSDRAWRLTHKKPELKAQTLLEAGRRDAQATVATTLQTIRSACEKVAPLRKHDAFDNYFRRGYRKRQESVQ